MIRKYIAIALATAGIAAAAPATLPKFSLPDLAGKAHASSEFAGKPVLIDFWATWCATCKESVPELIKIKSQFAAKGLQIADADIRKVMGEALAKAVMEIESGKA